MSNIKEIIESGKAFLGIELHPEATHGRTVTRTDCGLTLWMISGQVFRTVTVTWQKMYRKSTE